jgi:hypothetical protein
MHNLQGEFCSVLPDQRLAILCILLQVASFTDLLPIALKPRFIATINGFHEMRRPDISRRCSQLVRLRQHTAVVV